MSVRTASLRDEIRTWELAKYEARVESLESRDTTYLLNVIWYALQSYFIFMVML
jgi:hypothetical protein